MLQFADLLAINVDDQLSDIIREAWEYLIDCNDGKLLVRQGERPFLLRRVKGQASLQAVTFAQMSGLLIRNFNWIKRGVTPEKTKNAKPPREAIHDMMSFAHPMLPEVNAIACTPYYTTDGHLVTTSGYNATAKTLLCLPTDLEGFDLAPVITARDVAAAVAYIENELLVDFPFATPGDKAAYWGGLLLPFVRPMIDGPTPLHLISASDPRTGKGLLADCLSCVAIGSPCSITTLQIGETRIENQLVSQMVSGAPLIALDNFAENRKLQSAVLAAILTSRHYSARKLHTNDMLIAENRALWLMTANNPSLTRELLHRSVRIRIVSGVENPATRSGFRHADLLHWVNGHRRELVSAILTIAEYWIREEKPAFSLRKKGAFESWVGVIGGILSLAKIPGFLENEEELLHDVDEERDSVNDFVTAWAEVFGTDPVQPKELASLCMEQGLLLPYITSNTQRGQQTQMGRLLQRSKDRVFKGLTIRAFSDPNRHGKMYRLVAVHKAAMSPEVPACFAVPA